VSDLYKDIEPYQAHPSDSAQRTELFRLLDVVSQMMNRTDLDDETRRQLDDAITTVVGIIDDNVD
jgi:hypothetical protein